MSAASSARYGVECPKCHAGPWDRCRTAQTGRLTDTHVARIDAWWLKQHQRKANP